MKEKVQAVQAKETNKKQQQKKGAQKNDFSEASESQPKGNWRLGNFDESPLHAPDSKSPKN